ncbi:phenylpyruvate tautomerase MIF-related protein [Neisseria sp.]|uniref:phenylpyruvate tautomerase MIF-related protein n=1 Tax=Neisseria sp. TaxID=192066 RepID=UPI0026DAE904|nr:phenylpyruvate tautomerase MIF-related protein [Neisseria sp.]MDO4907772.1 phenylpyruvate tautomerase MIF-related protein [Neisseria sp.]
MAFITICTNQTVSPNQQTEIAKELGQAVACVPNQSAERILITFDDKKAMVYRDTAPVALVTFRAFGNKNHLGYRELTARISRILHRILGIERERVFVEFGDITAFGVGDF